MVNSTDITIKHIRVSSSLLFEQVVSNLETRLGAPLSRSDFTGKLNVTTPSWKEVATMVEQQLGTSGFSLFGKIDQGSLLALQGKTVKAVQYIIGNPLLAVKMIELEPEAALYAPLKLVIYEQSGETCVAYEKFTSQLAQYSHPSIAEVAQIVEEKITELITEITRS